MPIDLPTLLNNYKPTTSTQALDRKQALSQQLMQSGSRASNPFINALANAVGSYQSAEAGIAQEGLAGQEAELKKALLLNDQAMKDRQFGLQEQGMANDQAYRNATLDISRANLDLARSKQARENALQTQVDPKTGNMLLFKGNAPVSDGLEKGMQWAVSPQGQRVAVAMPAQPNEKAQAAKDSIANIADRLIKNESGIKSNFGALDRYLPNMTDAAMNAETDLNQLRALLTVENLGLMSGVLSETDIKILQNVAGGGIADTATAEGAINAIKSIKSTLGGEKSTKDNSSQPIINQLPAQAKQIGFSEGKPVYQSPDGKMYVGE
jgi:hypothetical protein